jgi:hypothetical protein
MYIYGVRIHDRETEEDPHLGTVMYSSRGEIGPWHDMVTGHPEWCWEVADALAVVNDMQVERQKQSAESLRAMLAEDRLEWPADESDESDATQVAEEPIKSYQHTPWDEFRKKVLRDVMADGTKTVSYSDATDSSSDAQLKRLQDNGDRLLACLEWAMDGRAMPEDMQDAITVWEEYRDG